MNMTVLYMGIAILGSGIVLTTNKYIRQTGLILTGIGVGLIGLAQVMLTVL